VEDLTRLESVTSDGEVFHIVEDEMDTIEGEVVCDSMLGLVVQLDDTTFTHVI
jgi:hypothetical protein